LLFTLAKARSDFDVGPDLDTMISNPAFKITCPQLDFVFSMETARFAKHTRKNERIAMAVDIVADLVLDAATMAAGAAGAAFGGPAAGKAASGMADALGQVIKTSVTGLLKYDDAVVKLRREIRGAWLDGYQSLIVTAEGAYQNDAVCTEQARHMMQLSNWFLNLDETDWVALWDKVNACATSSHEWVNKYDRYKLILTILGRKIGMSFAPAKLEYTVKNLAGDFAMGLVKGGTQAAKTLQTYKKAARAEEEKNQQQHDPQQQQQQAK